MKKNQFSEEQIIGHSPCSGRAGANGGCICCCVATGMWSTASSCSASIARRG